MRRYWRYNDKVFVPGTGGGAIFFAAFIVAGYKVFYEKPMDMRLTKAAIKNGETSGYYRTRNIAKEKPKFNLSMY